MFIYYFVVNLLLTMREVINHEREIQFDINPQFLLGVIEGFLFLFDIQLHNFAFTGVKLKQPLLGPLSVRQGLLIVSYSLSCLCIFLEIVTS